MQGLGLVGLLVGVVPLVVASSLSPVFVVSAVFSIGSGVLALAGTGLLRSHSAEAVVSNRRSVDYLILAMTLMFSGVGLILVSNVATYFFLSSVGNTVCSDVGAAASACGCVIASSAFYVLHPRPWPS